jgi:hypothetical protein
VLIILNSGLTGVERGAYRAARCLGVRVAGYMPSDRRDELGPIPADLDSLLVPADARGPRQAQVANVHIASGVVLVVPEANRVTSYTAMRQLRSTARARSVPMHVCDASSDGEEVASWCRGLSEAVGEIRVFITGPRQTRWRYGELAGRHIASTLILALASPTILVGRNL